MGSYQEDWGERNALNVDRGYGKGGGEGQRAGRATVDDGIWGIGRMVLADWVRSIVERGLVIAIE